MWKSRKPSIKNALKLIHNQPEIFTRFPLSVEPRFLVRVILIVHNLTNNSLWEYCLSIKSARLSRIRNKKLLLQTFRQFEQEFLQARIVRRLRLNLLERVNHSRVVLTAEGPPNFRIAVFC